MANILTDVLFKAVDMRQAILLSRKFDREASYGARLCEALAAANNNDL